MANSASRRVVVTGMGAITPIGITLAEYHEGLMTGRNGVDYITHFDTSHHGCKIAAEVKDFDPTLYMEKKDAKRFDRFAQFAIAAAKQAVADAKLEITELNAEQIGVLIGTGIGGLKVLEDQHEILRTKGPDRNSPFMIPMMIGNIAAGLTAIQLGAKGPCSCSVTACAAGSNAIGDAFRLVRDGYAQAMVCGGTESAITALGISGFVACKALSTSRNHDPKSASRPFDKDRDGFVMGEGAGIYAEVLGYGMTCDAYHITGQTPHGADAARAISLALKDAGITPDQVDYINAHGTSTPVNDPNETEAIKTALGDRAQKITVSSTKSMTGHLLGGSGGIEAVATVLAITHDRVPPTINLDNPDEGCDLDYVAHESRDQIVNVALSNSFGFGGHNVTLVFKKYLAG
jgi:3-oxoacyl-[acyl-carrier-protein] synthase II